MSKKQEICDDMYVFVKIYQNNKKYVEKCKNISKNVKKEIIYQKM